jgi:hypothetical protein
MTKEKPQFPFPIRIITPAKEVMIVKREEDLPEDYKILATEVKCNRNVMLFLSNK